MKQINGQKYCPKCRRLLNALENFGRDTSRQDGLHIHCKLCRRGYRLLRKPIPETQFVAATNYPRRTSVPMSKWEEFDQLVDSGVAVTIRLPNGTVVDWKDLQ